MPFIRLSDNYIDHPKFVALSAAAFRIWHEGMAFCRKHQTDGVITVLEAQGFRYFKPSSVIELTRPYREGKNPLWDTVAGVGYRVHDYLEWNPSKDEEQKRQAENRDRAKEWRTNHVRTRYVQDRDRNGSGSGSVLEKEFEEKPSAGTVSVRANQLQERYASLYAKHRHGAKLRLIGNSLDYQDACSLCATWDDGRLEKLAVIVLTTDEEFISKTDRSFKIFAMKASWADDKLRQWEKTHGEAV